ncbi:hypothetical protein BH24CHL6_BH24CHL6_05370 [soil metagenome]
MTSRLTLASVLACLLAASVAGLVMAHAALVESDPANGETVGTPATLTALFDEELERASSQIVVRNAAGQEVARGGVSDEDELVMVVELPQLPPGDYLARWTAVTPDDGGVTRGTINFAVAQPTATDPPAPTSTPAVATPAATAAPLPTDAPTPTASGPLASPTPAPDEGAPTAGLTDVLLALLLAGAIIGGLALYLIRRR